MNGQGCRDAVRLAEYADGVLQGREKERFERHLASCGACLEDLRALYEDRLLFRRWLRFRHGTDFRPVGAVRMRQGSLEVVKSGCTAAVTAEETKEAAGRKAVRGAAVVRFETSRGPVLLTPSGTATARLELRWKGGTAEVRRSGRLVGRGRAPLVLPVESRGRYELIADGRTVLTIRFS